MNNIGVTVCLFMLLLPLKINADQSVAEISAEQWAIPRHGERILSFPEIRNVMSEWHKDTSQSIEISYPGGESGELWLTELKDWLIALGVASVKIKSIAGSGSSEIIKLSVIRAGGNTE